MDRYTYSRSGKIGSDKAVEHLINVLNHKFFLIGLPAAEALGKIGSDRAVESLINVLELNSFEHGFKPLGVKAAEALGKIGSDKAVEPLINALQDEDFSMARSAVDALLKIIGDSHVELLMLFLENHDSDVRWRAAELLSKIASGKNIELLIKKLKDKNTHFFTRASVAEALGKIGTNKAVEPLIQFLLKDQSPKMRIDTATALGRIGGSEAVESLIQALKDKNPNVRGEVGASLVNMSITDRNLPTLTKQLPHLLTLIPTESSQQALSVITAIQARCKYYNYDIAQTPFSPEDNPNPTTGNTYNFYDKVGQVVENLTVRRDNIATQNNQNALPES